MNKKELLRAVKFTLFSLSAGIIQIGSFTLLNELVKWPWWPSHLISLTLSVLWNFTLNRKFTFQSAANVPVAMLKTLGYYVVYTPTSLWLGNYLTGTLLWNNYVVEVLVMLLNFVTEFLFQRFFVFGKSLDTNKKQEAE
jgi:putative flippase GtrA